jgi:SAM-dependent methyltransferase
VTRRQGGAVRIFLYNWPIYVATWVTAATALVVFPALHLPGTWLAVAGAAGALAWSILSLVVSLYVYDASRLVSGQWVPGLVTSTGAWATIHAGLDAEVELDAVMRGRRVARLDIFDRRVMTSPSIARARMLTPAAGEATACSASALALDDEACDAIVVAFTAHEIRDRHTREAFFCELRRSLKPGGKVLLVEHLRDVANFVAFGPGFLHFVSRREWLRLASHADLAIASETRITPWVMALALERPA